MFYRVFAFLNFKEPDEARDFYHDCQLALYKSNTINPGLINEEKGRIELQLCHHDETPHLSCEITAHQGTE